MAALEWHCHNSIQNPEAEKNPCKTGLFWDAGMNTQNQSIATFITLNIKCWVLPIHAKMCLTFAGYAINCYLADARCEFNKKVQDCTHGVRSCVRNKEMLKSLWKCKKQQDAQVHQISLKKVIWRANQPKPDVWTKQMALHNVLRTEGCTMGSIPFLDCSAQPLHDRCV